MSNGFAAHRRHTIASHMARVLILLPQTDFDPTEVAIPWVALARAGHDVTFATETGAPASCDPVTLTGEGLPFLARSMKARPENRALYEAMAASPEFLNPVAWGKVDAATFDAFHFPGGHAPGMKPYLESEAIRSIARAAFAADKPVSAICHGVIPLVRAKRPDGHALLHGRKTTALTNGMENIAVSIARHVLGNHYRTYPVSVEDEVRAALASPSDFQAGPLLPRYATKSRPERGFVVKDGNYISARWPGDAWTLAIAFCRMLCGHKV